MPTERQLERDSLEKFHVEIKKRHEDQARLAHDSPRGTEISKTGALSVSR